MKSTAHKTCLRIFLSSPGDVALERSFVRRILRDELAVDPLIADYLSFDVVSWDDPVSPIPMLAAMTPQEAINHFGYRPSECDIVIVILWSRFGTSLDITKFSKPNGTPYLSGTEWEYEDALARNPPPYILIYRRMEEPIIKLTDPGYGEKKEQYEIVQKFFDRFRLEDGAYRAGVNNYDTPEQFRLKVTSDIKHIIRLRLKATDSSDNDDVDTLLTHNARIPPSNLAAEQALIGALLSDNSSYDKVSYFLLSEHFADPVHGRIYRSIARRIDASEIADPVTLRSEFEYSGILDEVGGARYLSQLLMAAVGVTGITEYGTAIYDSWVRRSLIDIAETMIDRAFAPEPEEGGGLWQIECAEESLFELTNHARIYTKPTTFFDIVAAAIRGAERAFINPGRIDGVSMGLVDLDRITGGLHPSDLIILAGRPGMGKTMLATKIALAAAESMLAKVPADGNATGPRGSVIIFSPEVSGDQLGNYLLAQLSRVESKRLQRGDLDESDFVKFVDTANRLQSLPLRVDDTRTISLSSLRTRCRRLRRTNGLELVVIDGLQSLNVSSGATHGGRQSSEVTYALKALALELHVPILVTSNLPDLSEIPSNPRPKLSELRALGIPESSVDVVMFLHREQSILEHQFPTEADYQDAPEKFSVAMEKWMRRMEESHNTAELIIAKQRTRPIGSMRLHFDRDLCSFSDFDEQR